MKFAYKFFAVAAALTVLAVAGVAQNLIGTWTGKVQIDASKMPKGQNPEQQKMIDSSLAVVKKMRISVNLRANKTYTATVSGVPGGTKGQASEGTWKVQGGKLWLTSLKENGKASTTKKPQPFVIAKNGKSFYMDAPGGGGMGGRVTFTR
ncbi:MAG: hypothetical protein WAO58_08980 [Fimbriimonadaceae bacterium]|mgnify:CR=1 FL=1